MFLAHGPNLFVAVPIGILWFLCLYSSPVVSYWLTRRRKHLFASAVAAIGIALSGYTTATEFPSEKADITFWFFAGSLPLGGAIAALFAALRVKPSEARDA